MQCLYCEASADPTLPVGVPYCAKCWSEEHPNVRAKLAAHHAQGITPSAFVQRMLAEAQVIEIEPVGPVVPGYVIEALAVVRATGETNMMHRRVVAEIAVREGAFDAACWLMSATPEEYVMALNRMGAERSR